MEMDSTLLASEDVDSLNCTLVYVDSEGGLSRSRVGSETVEEGDEDEGEGLLRLPEMSDTSMDSVGQPLREVIDRFNGVLDKEEPWEPTEEKQEGETKSNDQKPVPPAQQPFREDSGGKPPDPVSGPTPHSPLVNGSQFLQTPPSCASPSSPDSAPAGGGCYDTSEHGQSQTVSGGHEDEREAKTQTGQELLVKEKDDDVQGEGPDQNKTNAKKTQLHEEQRSPSETSHPAEFRYDDSLEDFEFGIVILLLLFFCLFVFYFFNQLYCWCFRVDNNHLLLLMIHVFRENEEQLFKVRAQKLTGLFSSCELSIMAAYIILNSIVWANK